MSEAQDRPDRASWGCAYAATCVGCALRSHKLGQENATRRCVVTNQLRAGTGHWSAGSASVRDARYSWLGRRFRGLALL